MKRIPSTLVLSILGAGTVVFVFARGGIRGRGAQLESEDLQCIVAGEALVLPLDLAGSALEAPDDSSKPAPLTELNSRRVQLPESATLPSDPAMGAVANAALEAEANNRAAQHRVRERESAIRRADRTAQQLSLSLGETLQLADCYQAIGQHRRETLAAMRTLRVDHETMKQTVDDLRTWQKDELTRQFGAKLAEQIEGLDTRSIPGAELR